MEFWVVSCCFWMVFVLFCIFLALFCIFFLLLQIVLHGCVCRSVRFPFSPDSTSHFPRPSFGERPQFLRGNPPSAAGSRHSIVQVWVERCHTIVHVSLQHKGWVCLVCNVGWGEILVRKDVLLKGNTPFALNPASMFSWVAAAGHAVATIPGTS